MELKKTTGTGGNWFTITDYENEIQLSETKTVELFGLLKHIFNAPQKTRIEMRRKMTIEEIDREYHDQCIGFTTEDRFIWWLRIIIRLLLVKGDIK